MQRNGFSEKKSKKRMRLIFLVGYLLAGLFLNSEALFLDDTVGARPAGMGDAFVAIADDGNAVLYNPAGLAQINSIIFDAMYADLFSQMNARLYTHETDRLGYHFLSLAIPLPRKHGVLGIAWSQFSSQFYYENMVYLSGARRLWDSFSLDLGVSLKMLNWHVPGEVIYGRGTSYGNTSGSLDLGFLAQPIKSLRVGASVANIVIAKGESQSVRIPIVWRFGTSYSLQAPLPGLDKVVFLVEETIRNYDYETRAGVEVWMVRNQLAIRSGINNTRLTTGLGVRVQPKAQSMALQINYAFAYPFYVQSNVGTHRLGLQVNWNPNSDVKKKRLEKEMIQLYEDALRVETLVGWAAAKKKWLAVLEKDPSNGSLEKYLAQASGRDQSFIPQQNDYQEKKTTVKAVRKRKIPGLDPKTQQLSVEINRFTMTMTKETIQSDQIQEMLRVIEAKRKQGNFLAAFEDITYLQTLDAKHAGVHKAFVSLAKHVRENIGAFFKQGMDAIWKKDYLVALKQFEMIAKISPDYQPAMAQCYRVKAIIEERFEKQFKIASMKFESGSYDESVTILEKMYEEWPRYPGLERLLRKAEAKRVWQNSAAETLVAIKEMIEMGENEKALLRLKPFIQIGLQKAKSQLLFDKALDRRARGLWHYHQGVLAYQKDRIKQMRYHFKQSLAFECDPQVKASVLDRMVRRAVSFYRIGNYLEALGLWEDVLVLAPKHRVAQHYLLKTRQALESP